MANDIKQKIVLEGEQQYRNALKDAQRNLKTLRSELKAETAELGANATAQEKSAARIRSLQKQIKEQEKIVKANKDALEEVRQKYADNADAIAKYEQKLNDSRTALANMKNELDSVGQGFKGVEVNAAQAVVASKSVADTLEKLGGIGDTIASSIETAFSGIIDKVGDTISAIWQQIVDLAARSNNLVDLAGYWNTDVTTIQKYKGAVAAASATLEDLNSIVTKINSKKSKDITELVGVSKEKYEDQWEYAMAVMDAMSKMDTQTRNKVGFELFGKGATKAFDLLNDWKTVKDNLDTFDVNKGGYGLTEEELQQMSDLYDKVNKLRESWQSLKDMATVKLFGQLSVDLTSNAQAIMDSLLKYFNAETDEERDAAFKEIEDNVVAMFERVGKAIEKGIEALGEIGERLKASDNPVVQKLGEVMTALHDALTWLTEDDAENFKKVLMIVAGAWTAGKVLDMIGSIGALIGHLATLKTAGGLSALTNMLTGTNLGAAGSAAGASWGAAFAKAVMKAAPWLIGLYTMLNPSDTSDETGNNTLVDKEGKLTKEAEEYGFYKDENGELAQDITKANPALVSKEMMQWKKDQEFSDSMNQRQQMTVAQWEALQKWWDEVERGQNGEFTDEQWDAINKAFEGNEETLDRLMDMIDYLKQSDEETNGKNTWQNMEDLPAYWWMSQGGNSGNTDGLTGQDARTMTQAVNGMPRAVQNGLSNVKVTMDGAVVGRLVAGEVSRQIAQYIQ